MGLLLFMEAIPEEAQEPTETRPPEARKSEARRRTILLRALIIASGLAAIAITFSFETAPGPRVAVRGTETITCSGGYITSDVGGTNTMLGMRGVPCPSDAKPIAVVVVDRPVLAIVCLIVIGITTISQAAFAKAD